MKIQSIFFILFFSVLFISCGSSKKAVGESLDASMNAKSLIDLHQAKEPVFKTLVSRMQVQYDDGEKSQSVTISLRIQKDETIWVSASILGITLSKMLITKDHVRYYETIGKTYFDGDFRLLSQWLGVTINYEMAQNILLGQAIFDLTTSKYTASVFGSNYRLTPEKQSQILKHIFLIQPDTYKIASQQIMQPAEQRIMTVDYDSYQVVEKQFFPKTIKITAIELEKQTRITLDYRNIDINAQVSFPFKIPNGYEEIRLD